MHDLTKKKCIPCEAGVPPLSGDKLNTYESELHEDWRLVDDKKIQREFGFKNFKEALAFANRVGEIAEQEQHHPDLHVAWGKVGVELWTHAIGGLSENDFIVAAKIDELE